jgi:hypothetical protein
MVSNRCKWRLRRVKKTQFTLYGCRFRRVEIMENITMDQRLQLKSALLDSGLELMDDKNPC